MVNFSDSLVSILLPVFNGGMYIEKTIMSILNQNDFNFELIICDDRSDDNSWKIINSFNDKKVKIFRNDTNIGMTQNYEKILSLSQGAWITIIGQDDFLLHNSIKKLRKYIQKDPAATILVSPRSYFYWQGVQKKRLFSIINLGVPVMTKHNCRKRYNLTKYGFTKYIYGPQLYTGTFIKRETIEKIKKRQEGIFFIGNIPDVSSAASLLYFSSSYNRIWESLVVVGTSDSSVGLRIHNALSKRSSEKGEEISLFFTKNPKLDKHQPGLNGSLSSFLYYFYEESCELERMFGQDTHKKAPSQGQKTTLLAAVLYEVLKVKNFKKSLQSMTVLKEIKNQQINKILFILYFLFFAISNILYDLMKYFFYVLLFICGRYKINSFNKDLVD